MKNLLKALVTFFLFKCLMFQNVIIEKSIQTNILTGYDKTSRPSDNVTLYLRMQLKQIINVNEINQIITTSSYFYVLWYDPRLVWNPTDYNSTIFIRVQANLLWLPDLYVLNTADSNGFILSTISNSIYAYVLANGDVYLGIGLIALNTRCSININKVQ